MGTTYATYESKIRADLSDESSILLSSADIGRHVDHAAGDLSLVSPLSQLITATATPNSRAINLTTAFTGYNVVRVLAVEWPVGAYPVNWVNFQLYGPLLTLLVPNAPTGADTVNVYTRVAMFAGSSSPASTIPGELDELLARRAGAYAAQELAARLMNTINIGGPVVWEHYLTLSQFVLKDTDAQLTMLAQKPIWFAGKLHAPMIPPPTWNYGETRPPESVYP